MTLSGIFRDLLPLQASMLAEASYLAAVADEPVEMNFIRKHALAYAKSMAATSSTPPTGCFPMRKGPMAPMSTS
jgi:cobalamin biosynthesis Mg chelatase CobN